MITGPANFINSQEGVDRVKTFLKGWEVDFQSAITIGNDDCPSGIELYADKDPLFGTKPVRVFQYDANEGIYEEVF